MRSRRRGTRVVEARDQAEAIQQLQQARPAVVLTDLKLPSGDGFGVLRAAKELDPELPVIVMTAYGSIQDAVAAMKEGAMDFLAKPVDPDHLLLMVERALAQRRLVDREHPAEGGAGRAARRAADHRRGPDAEAGVAALQRAAATDATVLLEGESGTGKELFARALHALSPRADGPFVAINCAAIPETLLETELFGHEKGAFTGAVGAQAGQVRAGAPRHAVPRRDRRPAARAAGEDPARARGEAVRARRRHRSRCTWTCAWSPPPTATSRRAVAAQQFREDLYFRLSVFPITHSAAARTRPTTSPMLARHFVERFCREMNKKPLTLSRRRRSTSCRSIRGRATCASCRTASSAPSILAEGDTIHPRHLNLSFRHSAPEPAQSPWAALGIPPVRSTKSRAARCHQVERLKMEETLAGSRRQQRKAVPEALQLPLRRAFSAKLKRTRPRVIKRIPHRSSRIPHRYPSSLIAIPHLSYHITHPNPRIAF